MLARGHARSQGERSIVQWSTWPILSQDVQGETPDGFEYVGADRRLQYGRLSGGGGLVMDWHRWDQVKSECGSQQIKLEGKNVVYCETAS